jgi:hypothetical protein
VDKKYYPNHFGARNGLKTLRGGAEDGEVSWRNAQMAQKEFGAKQEAGCGGFRHYG